MKPVLPHPTNSSIQNPLFLPEIAQWVYYICQQKDGYHLARTCSDLFHSLMPLVWESVNGVEQLLTLIDGTNIYVDTSNNVQILIAHKVLVEKDLSRFKFYAPFVRRLNPFSIKKYGRYSISGWEQLLKALGSNPLLPNLHTLTFNASSTATVSEQRGWFSLLQLPSIRELNLVATSSDHSELNSSIVQLFFESVSAIQRNRVNSLPFNNISSISKQITSTGTGIERISWKMGDLANLSKLVIPMSILTLRQLSTIGLLPRLESLDFDFGIDFRGETAPSYSTPDLPDDTFPRLKHLGLTNLPDTSSFHTVWSLKPLISRLTSVTLHFNKYRWMEALTYDQIMSDFISPISEEAPALVDLAFLPPEYEWNEVESSVPLFGLLSRLSLARLQFAPMMPLHLYILPNTAKYPLLRRLELTSSWVGVADLKALAMLFPNLDYLVVQITINPEDLQDVETTPTSPQSIILCITSVFLEKDPLWDRAVMGDKLARFLRSVWPNALYITREGDTLRHKFILPWVNDPSA